ncbi:MAG: hypothetical protein U0798_21635 [Gemmataceae bacterium]
MKRSLFTLLALVPLLSLGCAEFEGYYDDNNRDHHRMANWSDNVPESTNPTE